MDKFAALALVMILAPVPAVFAQQEEMPWRATVTAQIEAFRAGDGAAALNMASEAFRKQFTDPEVFLAAIKGLGYGPLVTSRSHTFGYFVQVNEHVVTQVVRLVGPDQSLYEATYQLGEEPGVGWRVQGVIMAKQQGIGV